MKSFNLASSYKALCNSSAPNEVSKRTSIGYEQNIFFTAPHHDLSTEK
ncbi:hypothetical protein EMIT0P291_190101 [Pseudomonas sp. IT-P291]